MPLNGENVSISVKSVGLKEEVRVGSVTVPAESFAARGESFSKIWITLFDHPEDDEYDGDLVEQDEEQPRLRLSLSIDQDNPSPAPVRAS